MRVALPRPSWLDIASRERLEREIGRAGFVDVEVSVFDAVLVVPSPREMWPAMRENPVTASLLRALSEEELSSVAASVLASFDELAGGPDRPLRLDASCHFAIARRA